MMAWKDGNALYTSTQCFSRARHEARQDSLQGKGHERDQAHLDGQQWWQNENAHPQPRKLRGITSAERPMAHYGSQDNTVGLERREAQEM